MSKKRFFCLIVSLVAFSFLALSFLSVDQAAAKKITIKAISAWPTNDNSVKIDYLGFVAHVNKKIQEVYPDEFEIRYIGGPEAIPTRDQADALRVGTVDMYFGTPAYYVGMAPAANTSKMTQLTPWEERDSGAAALFDEIHRNKLNSVYLGRLGTQIQFQLFLNKQVQTPDDLKGMRIRVSPMYIDFVKALGAIPIETKPGDIYQGLERGVFDGTYWPFNKFREWGFHEVAKYIVGPGIYDVCHPVLINLDTWNKIPVRISGLITAVMMQEERAVVARDYEEIKQETEGLKAAGLTFIEFSPADAQRYIDLSQSSGWQGLIQRAPEWGPTLRKLLSK
jgi:TRAP-type mannitol/chloroaromatic compound transport system substrate-binding protein